MSSNQNLRDGRQQMSKTMTGSQNLPSMINSSQRSTNSGVSFNTPVGFMQSSSGPQPSPASGGAKFFGNPSSSSVVQQPGATRNVPFNNNLAPGGLQPETMNSAMLNYYSYYNNPYMYAAAASAAFYYPYMYPALYNNANSYAAWAGYNPSAGSAQWTPQIRTNPGPNPGNNNVLGNETKNIQFMCSYGGLNKIVSFERGVSFNELKQKLKNMVGGQSVDITYHHPDVGSSKPLSVSSQADLDHMKQVYKKLAKSSPDGWSKLNIFLIPSGGVADSGFSTPKDISLQIIRNTDLVDLQELGSGTYGTVHHGRWLAADVAIKRMKNTCFGGKGLETMEGDFLEEATKLAKLKHPNVITFYGISHDGPVGSLAIVTEYMVDGSLSAALGKNRSGFDRSKRVLIASDVACGMEYLHSENIVHFDLKSANLLLNLRDAHRPICKVGDFGLSKVKQHSLIAAGPRGTIKWMAPELLNRSTSFVSNKVDVYSFGIVMWELLTGKEPYAGWHVESILAGVVSGTLRPFVPDCCELDWRCLMEKCWSPDPSNRPSFKEIVKVLSGMSSE